MSKLRLPTLKQVAGERPRCQYCDKELKPVTCTVELTGHITAPPTVDKLLHMAQPNPTWPPIGIAVERGYRPDRVFQIRHKTNYMTEPATAIHFWTGKYHGYRYTGTPKLFCNNDCGRLFGLAAWRASYPMKGHESQRVDACSVARKERRRRIMKCSGAHPSRKQLVYSATVS